MSDIIGSSAFQESVTAKPPGRKWSVQEHLRHAYSIPLSLRHKPILSFNAYYRNRPPTSEPHLFTISGLKENYLDLTIGGIETVRGALAQFCQYGNILPPRALEMRLDIRYFPPLDDKGNSPWNPQAGENERINCWFFRDSENYAEELAHMERFLKEKGFLNPKARAIKNTIQSP